MFMTREIWTSPSWCSRRAALLSCCRLCFFFFQAEDGIRDLTVTGVQTCALPISLARVRASAVRGRSCLEQRSHGLGRAPLDPVRVYARLDGQGQRGPPFAEIGRASCRERV